MNYQARTREPIRLSVGTFLGLVTTVMLGIMTAKFVLSAPTYFILAAVLAIILSLVLFRNLELGILAYFFFAAIAFGESPGVQSPNSHYKAGLMPSEVFLLFMTLIWVAKLIFKNRSQGFAKSPLNLPLLTMGCVSIAAMVMSNLLRGSHSLLFHQLPITQVAEVGLLWCSILAFFLVSNNLKTQSIIQRLSIPIVIFGTYYGFAHLLRLRLPMPLGSWAYFLLTATIAIIYSRALFAEMSRRKRIWSSILLLILVASAYSDLSWISGLLSVSAVLFLITLYKSKAMALVLVALALVILFIYPGKYWEMQEESVQGGDMDRFIIWQDAFTMFMKVDPVLGIGPGNYNPYIAYHSTIWWGNNEHTYTTAHNNFVGIAAEQGLLGLAVFLWVIGAALFTGHRASKRAPPELRWLGIAATALFAGMAASCIGGDYLLPSRGNNGIVTFGTTVYTWLLLGTAVAAMNLPHSENGKRAEQLAIKNSP